MRARQLAQKEGIFVGITAGATFAGALEVCKSAAPGSTVLAMLPDTGERYLSTPLFADIGVDMNEDELKISNSTPNSRCRRSAYCSLSRARRAYQRRCEKAGCAGQARA